jgi:hypothetical protein
MSKYVFTNPERTRKIYADDCTISNKDIMYYCPTPNCPARLTIRSLTGDVNPYFSALKSYPHDESICSSGRTQNFKAKYNVSNFSIEALYNSVISRQRTNNTGAGRNQPPSANDNNSEEITTPTKLYYYCKGHDINHIVNGTIMVQDLIADSRTNFIFTKNIHGFKLVESKFNRYSDSNKSINVIYSVNPLDRNHHKLTLNFTKPEDYNKIKKKLFTHSKDYSSVFIVTLGNWNNNECTIDHWKQVVLI